MIRGTILMQQLKSSQRTSLSCCSIMMDKQLNWMSLSGQRGLFTLVFRNRRHEIWCNLSMSIVITFVAAETKGLNVQQLIFEAQYVAKSPETICFLHFGGHCLLFYANAPVTEIELGDIMNSLISRELYWGNKLSKSSLSATSIPYLKKFGDSIIIYTQVMMGYQLLIVTLV
ncbi:hypothetical protein Nepgr_002527 [Nepenthes gracilis]|uniref:Uncharacterized protein n=1 Tax=Nepenthes gracilis TaxID=150966 RepID=A0AAD3P747_NEPGR|nr:hypothetical protein Nepgr_002527 [Nepenthes gracilis]